MKLLLDTHALVWALADPAKLPARIRDDVREPANEVFVSPANIWEIAIKHALGKIDAEAEAIATAAAESGFKELPVRIPHTVRIASLPAIHRDPFDRLLIAQALVEELTLATRDRVFRSYGVTTRWR
ncbi:MAG: type II toxin-antitoxin system VapC family toxin [Candidatus Binatia bacterium]